jgi:N-acetylmuramoyl-L-alanine amidase
MLEASAFKLLASIRRMSARLACSAVRRTLAAFCLAATLIAVGCGRASSGGPVSARTISAAQGATATGPRIQNPSPHKNTLRLAHARLPKQAPSHVSSASAVASFEALRPQIVQDPIPFPPHRMREMQAYARVHYGLDTYRLLDPHVIVEHYTETSGFRSTYEIFAPDHPDSELHELPNTCAHFVVGRDGTIHQLVALDVMCRHTVGLNYTAIGIENVGYSDREILGNRAELRASLELTRWLRCRYRIPIKDVIGHSESLSSPYHHEDVPSLRSQTHSDWLHADMQVYRALLRALPCD